jgi:hypothetical protein
MFRLNADALTYRQPCNACAEGDDFTAQFVSSLMGLPRPVRILPSVRMQITTTNPGRQDLEQHFARGRFRHRQLF